MRSTVQALVWEFLFRGASIQALMITVACSMMLVYASLQGFGVGPGDQVYLILQYSLMPTVMGIILLSVTAAQRSMSRLYLKPLSNLSIAMWHIVAGWIAVAVELAAVMGLFNWQYRAGWPIWESVCFACVGWVVAQPLLCMGSRTFLSFFLTALPCLGMLVWFISHFGKLSPKTVAHPFAPIQPLEGVALIVVAIVFAGLTVWSVRWDRIGASSEAMRWWDHAWAWFDRGPWSGLWEARRFRNPSQAQFWYEWNRKGWMLPLSATLFLLLLIVVNFFSANQSDWASRLSAIEAAWFGVFASLVILGTCSGLLHGLNLDTILATNDRSRARSSDAMGSFLATRPLDNRELATVALKVNATGYGFTLLILGLSYVIYQGLMGALGVPLVAGKSFLWQSAVALVAVVWALQSNAMTITLSGHTARWMTIFGWWLIGVCVALGVTRWVGGASAAQQLLDFVYGLMLFVITCFAAVAFAVACQRSYVKPVFALALWIVAIVLAITWCNVIPQRLMLRDYSMALLVSMLCVLPFATTPWAVAANRHR